ncbi:hypothetical protein HI850_006875 [bacterium SPL81]|nr:hypothetical protein [Acinetobacter baumannii]
MVVHYSSEFQKIKELENFGDREIQWIWASNNLQNTFPQTSFSSTLEKKRILFDYINQLPIKEDFINTLLIGMQNNLIDKKHIEWIDKNDSRILLFLIFSLSFKCGVFIQKVNYTNLYDIFLFNLDIYPSNIDSKINFINSLREEWHIYSTPFNEIKWIKKDDILQIDWAYQYLNKNQKLIPTPLAPIHTNDKYNIILSSLDIILFANSKEYKELFLLKMRKTWSQKKFRDSGKVKKNYHLPLTNMTQKKLEKLAELKNCRKEQVIEQLIIKEFEILNLDENGKLKYK